MILEEGLSIADLRRISQSMRIAADEAGVSVITGDTKVVERGAADKIFINTTAIGVIPEHLNLSSQNAVAGDLVIVNGYIGDHGAAIVSARGDLALESNVESDVQPLNKLLESLLRACPQVHCIRDATRGGIATVLNEFAISSNCNIRIHENAIPYRPEVRGMCEILGLDPLYLANEGKVVIVVPAQFADTALEVLHQNKYGTHSTIIGSVSQSPEATVILETVLGGERIVDMLIGDQLPRIC